MAAAPDGSDRSDDPGLWPRTSFDLGPLRDYARHWARFVGPGRLLTAVGTVLVLSGVAWWLLRSPPLPTEARLPLASHAATAGSGPPMTAVGHGVAPAIPVGATAPSTTGAAIVVVHVAGAVEHPGVYELDTGGRVADAIAAAGGAIAGADPDALNLAAPVADGDRIAVPVLGAEAVASNSGEAPTGHSHSSSADGQDPTAPVGLNTATAAQLETLPGIGPATAAAIIQHRDEHGPYAAIDELLDVRGIGTAKLEAIRPLVVL